METAITFEEEFESVEDITEPSLVARILERYEEMRFEDDEFMEKLLEKLPDMQVTWQQPWYQKTGSLTVPLRENKNEKETFKKDRLSYEEGQIVYKNWKKFRKMYGVPNKLKSFARWRNKKCCNPSSNVEVLRRFVLSFLAQGLERNLHQLYNYIVSQYAYTSKGRYNKYEENIIEIFLYHHPKSAATYLTVILGRPIKEIYRKISYFFDGKPERKVVKWDLELSTKFLHLLMQYTNESVVDNLKQRRIDMEVWRKLEQEIGHQHYYLQYFWIRKLHVQLFVKGDVKMKYLRRKIYNLIRRYPYKVWKDIRWKELAKHFPDGFTDRFLYTTTYTSIYKLHNFLTLPLEDVISYGWEKTKFHKNRRLKTLVLNEDQKLEVIRYENKLKLIM